MSFQAQNQTEKPSTQQIVADAADRLLDALRQGRSEAMAEYLRVMGRFHRYSLNNVLLIALQRPAASHVCGFKTWLSLGRHVRKGEKGIKILAPIIGKKKVDDSQPEEERNSKTMVYGFRTVFVFDLEQTDGENLPSAPDVQGDASEHLNALLEFVRKQGITVEFSEGIAPALGVSCGGRILLDPGHSEAETLATLVHEYAHESMHKDDRRTHTTKTVRETEAEAVAFAVCSGLGLDCGSSSSDYIGLYDGNADTLLASLGIVQKTACQILDALTLPVQRLGE
jgi:antirestriction protein ArdC